MKKYTYENSEWINREYIREYLDEAIHFWRGEQERGTKKNSQIFIDCFQSVRSELIGKRLQYPEQGTPPQMVRPQWAVFIKDVAGGVECNCGRIVQTTKQAREHWQDGHFDYVAPVAEEPQVWDENTAEVLDKYRTVFEELIRIERKGE